MTHVPIKMKRKVSWLLFTLAIGASLFFVYRELTDFSLANITMELPNHPEWTTPPPTAEDRDQLSSIIDQPFTYLGKGNQTYVFESQDHKYVLKFFKFGHLKPSLFFDNAPLKSKKIARIFSSHQLAYERNKDNAALLFVHLNKTNSLHLVAHVRDKWGFRHDIDLDSVVFVVQEKAIPARVLISHLLDRGDVASATKRFQSLIGLFLSEYSRGIYDQDHNLMHNTGFIGDKPVRFDVGKMAKDEEMKTPEGSQKDLAAVMRRIDHWLGKYYPQYAEEIRTSLVSLH